MTEARNLVRLIFILLLADSCRILISLLMGINSMYTDSLGDMPNTNINTFDWFGQFADGVGIVILLIVISLLYLVKFSIENRTIDATDIIKLQIKLNHYKFWLLAINLFTVIGGVCLIVGQVYSYFGADSTPIALDNFVFYFSYFMIAIVCIKITATLKFEGQDI